MFRRSKRTPKHAAKNPTDTITPPPPPPPFDDSTASDPAELLTASEPVTIDLDEPALNDPGAYDNGFPATDTATTTHPAASEIPAAPPPATSVADDQPLTNIEALTNTEVPNAKKGKQGKKRRFGRRKNKDTNLTVTDAVGLVTPEPAAAATGPDAPADADRVAATGPSPVSATPPSWLRWTPADPILVNTTAAHVGITDLTAPPTVLAAQIALAALNAAGHPARPATVELVTATLTDVLDGRTQANNMTEMRDTITRWANQQPDPHTWVMDAAAGLDNAALADAIGELTTTPTHQAADTALQECAITIGTAISAATSS